MSEILMFTIAKETQVGKQKKVNDNINKQNVNEWLLCK